MEAYEVLLRPVITERSMAGVGQGRYTFAVDPRANKHQIRQAVEQAFKVHVEAVRTMNVHPKKRRRGAAEGQDRRWKKAIVTLRPGETIEVFDQIL